MFKKILFNNDTSQITLYPEWLENPDMLFHELKHRVDWQTRNIQLFGRTHKIPRLESFVGDSGLSYIYSGKDYLTEAWPNSLVSVKAQVTDQFSWLTNCALLNYYRDGSDSMGWHSDDEHELGHNPTIAILSLGAVRDLYYRESKNNLNKLKIKLGNGSLLVAEGTVQSDWQHSVPKRANAGERISCTFRKIVT